MFYRKLYVALFTSILAIIGLNIFEPVPVQDGGLLLGILVYSTYVVPIIYIYGIVSSVIADKISLKAERYREMVSFGLHLLFGMGFIIPYSIFLEFEPFPQLTFVNVITHPVALIG